MDFCWQSSPYPLTDPLHSYGTACVCADATDECQATAAGVCKVAQLEDAGQKQRVGVLALMCMVPAFFVHLIVKYADGICNNRFCRVVVQFGVRTNFKGRELTRTTKKEGFVNCMENRFLGKTPQKVPLSCPNPPNPCQ